MLKGRTVWLMLTLLSLFLVSGCGSGGNSDTNGRLALTVTTTDGPGETSVDGSAIFSNTTATPPLSGLEITITLSAHPAGGPSVVTTFKPKTDDTGTVYFHQPYTQTSETIFVDVTATTGGVSSPTVRVTVPPVAAP